MKSQKEKNVGTALFYVCKFKASKKSLWLTYKYFERDLSFNFNFHNEFSGTTQHFID